MADPFASLKDDLRADSTLLSLLTGGVWDDEDVGAQGLSLSTAQTLGVADSNGLILPHAFIRWGNTVAGSARGAGLRGEMRFLLIYVQDVAHAGYSTVESALTRIKDLLDYHERTVSGGGIHVTRWMDDSPRLRNEALLDAGMRYARFVDQFMR